MEKKVSVIVPVYRTLEWLARCVQSITGQTYKNLEIILVDDGSPDDCPVLNGKNTRRKSYSATVLSRKDLLLPEQKRSCRRAIG